MTNEFNIPAASHHLELTGREHLTVSGEDLHIGKLSLEGGELFVDGRIDSVAYEDSPGHQGGFFSRLFG